MSSVLSNEVRRSLAGSRLVALSAPANAGVGERRSRALGAGIEFAQYRDYEPGDDLRYVDRHVYARLGRVVVRQFNVEQRLRVSVLLDGSASIGIEPEGWRRAVELAAVFGEVALNGADQVRFGWVDGDRIRWGEVATRRPKLYRELDRLVDVRPQGASPSMERLAARSLEALKSPGLLVVISDWLVDGFTEALRLWRAVGQELVAIQVLGSAEAGDGPLPGTGRLRLVDAETGEASERLVDERAWSAYRSEIEAWSDDVRAAVWAVEGRWVRHAAALLVSEHTVRDFRQRGLIT